MYFPEELWRIIKAFQIEYKGKIQNKWIWTVWYCIMGGNKILYILKKMILLFIGYAIYISGIAAITIYVDDHYMDN